MAIHKIFSNEMRETGKTEKKTINATTRKIKDTFLSKTCDKTFRHFVTHTHVMIEMTWTEPMLKSKALTVVQNKICKCTPHPCTTNTLRKK